MSYGIFNLKTIKGVSKGITGIYDFSSVDDDTKEDTMRR